MPNDFNQDIICEAAEVQIIAAEGESSGPAKFNVVAYTGGAMSISGWDLPIVIDLDGLQFGKSLVANLDHDRTKRVGNVTSKMVNSGTLVLGGVASAATESRREVIESADSGFVWQASVEVQPSRVEQVAKGKTVEVNGQSFEGPLYVTRAGTLKGFAFVSHGADDNTQVSIAASAEEPKKGKTMNAEFKSWVESIGFDADNLSDTQRAGLEANFNGKAGNASQSVSASNPFESRKIEAKRRQEIRAFAGRQIELRESSIEEINEIEKMVDHSIEAGDSVQQFKNDFWESMQIPQAKQIRSRDRNPSYSNAVIEAAVCQAARIPEEDMRFSDQVMQTAHDTFKGRIGLKDLFHIAAEVNGEKLGYSADVEDLLRASFGSNGSKRTIDATGMSTLSISNIVSNTANKFIMRGWNMVDQTPLRIAKIQNVRDFKTITTVSLTDSVIYEKVGAAGEIKHGTLSELTYTNKADTYAKMLAITRQDIINDDLGALTDVPMKLGNGAMKKLNDIFWTEFLGLVSANFFASANINLLDGVATMTTAGLARAETLFMNQTNPDGTPLGVMPQILLVPTALKSAAFTLMNSEKLIDGTATATQGDANVFRGRFRIESSPYISNSTYTGNTAAGWWMLADPNELPVIAIAALNGRVEPIVNTAEADFNVLGIQMRGYSDVGVNDQEYRGGLYADGGAS